MTEPIVIAHLIATNFYGGPEKQILTHAAHLNPAEYQFVLISFVENGQQNEILQKASKQGVKSFELPSKHALDFRTVLKLRKILQQQNVHLLCSHGYKANIIGRLSSWWCRIPQIAVSRGWTAENRKIRAYESLDKIFLKLDDHIVAVSHGQKKKILDLGLSSESISVIHNAIEIETEKQFVSQIRSELSVPDGAILVASAGRLSPEKNYAAMIEVAQKLCPGREDLYFVIFGEGFLRSDLEASIKDLGLEKRFLLPGFRKDLPSIFPEIDVFMLPSFTEGLPNVVLEAYAAKKPVIATMVGGTPEVVLDGVSGFLVDPLATEKMAHHLMSLVRDQDLRRRMGQAGYDFVRASFDFQDQTTSYQNLYKELRGGQ